MTGLKNASRRCCLEWSSAGKKRKGCGDRGESAVRALKAGRAGGISESAGLVMADDEWQGCGSRLHAE
jgi:hypothetical protein